MIQSKFVSIFLSCILIFFFNSCNQKSNKSAKKVEIIDLGQDSKAVDYCSLFSKVQYFPLETKKNCLIGEVTQFQESNNRFFILDIKTKNIYVFNINGKFLNRIGSQGKGPGEFLFPKQFVINENDSTLHLYDSNSKKIIQYNFDGSLKKEIKLNTYFRSFIFDQKSNSYFAHISAMPNMNLDHNRSPETLKLIRIDKVGNITDFVYGTISSKLRLSFSFIISGQSNGSISFVEPLEESVFTYDGKAVTTKYNINFGEETVPKNVKKELNILESPRTPKEIKNFQITFDNYFLGFYRFFENDKWVFFSYSHKKQSQYILYDKKLKKPFRIFESDINDSNKQKFFMPVFMSKNSIYAVAEPNELIVSQNSEVRNPSSTKTNMILDLKENDNPVIIKYEFK